MLSKARDAFKRAITNILAADAPPAQRPVAQTPSATMIGDAPITISLAQLDEMRADLRAANARHAAVVAELATARTADPSERVHKLNVLARDMLTILRYAIANLPPSENPKWPSLAVTRVANGLEHLPDFSGDDRVLRSELHLLVRDIEEHEIDRARKRDKLIASAPDRVVATPAKDAIDNAIVDPWPAIEHNPNR